MIILHIISNLQQGGAERVLFNLVTSDKLNKHIIVSLGELGFYGYKLKKLNYIVYSINFNKNKFNFFKYYSLFSLIKKHKPNIVQTWMYHADFIGGIFAKLLGIKKIIWGLRNSALDKKKINYITRVIIYINSKLSYYIPTHIVSCSKVAIIDHENIGYNSKIFLHIPNGFYTNIKTPETIINNLYSKYNIDQTYLTFSNFARWDEQKDHRNLLNAFKIFKMNFKKKWVLFLAGKNIDSYNPSLMKLIIDYNLKDNIILLGKIDNVFEYFSIININILASQYGEGFPNIIAEGMISGVPCISTNIGDSNLIIQNSGWIVEPKNPDKLNKAILLASNEYLVNNFKERSLLCKKIINEEFSLKKMIKNFNNLYNT